MRHVFAQIFLVLTAGVLLACGPPKPAESPSRSFSAIIPVDAQDELIEVSEAFARDHKFRGAAGPIPGVYHPIISIHLWHNEVHLIGNNPFNETEFNFFFYRQKEREQYRDPSEADRVDAVIDSLAEDFISRLSEIQGVRIVRD